MTLADLNRLAEAARGGDRDALDEFVHATYAQVRRLCAVLVDDASADDLAQDSFIRAIGALRRFRGESGARTWLFSIVRHTCADELRTRTRQRRRHRELVDTQAYIVAAPDAGEQVGILDLISRLDQDRREAFMLTQVLHLSYAEAAAVCQCPTGTVHSRVARAREDLIAMYSMTAASARSR